MNRSIAFAFILILLIITTGETQAQFGLFQRGWQESKVSERGMVILVGAGVTAVRSDICGSWGCNDFGANATVGGMYKFSPGFAVGPNADYLRLGATANSGNNSLNVAFQSEVIALTGNAYINLLDSYAGSGNYRSSGKRFVVPYIRAGAGGIYYSATSFPAEKGLQESQTTYDPERKYPALAVVIPIGGGLRFRFSDEIAIAPELVYHITTSDYLDNVGPRLGDGATKDHYGLFTIKLMYTPLIKNNIFSRNR